MNKSQYIDEFTSPSKIHESLLVGYLYAKPTLYAKYKNRNITESSFTEDIWWFYYKVGEMMYDNGIRNFDDKTVYSFMVSRPQEKGKPSYIDSYNNFGGYSTIFQLIEECSNDTDNEEYHADEVQKYEVLRWYQREGLINTSNKNLVDKVCKMTLQQVKMFFQYQCKKPLMHVNSGDIKISNLLDGLNETVSRLSQGISMGLSLKDSPRLNKKIKGWQIGNLMYLVLSSGVGKTSIMTEKFILAAIEGNEKTLLFANEEGKEKFQALLLATVSAKILYKPISRERILEGHYSEEEQKRIQASAEWLQKHRPDIIKIIEMERYRIEDVLDNIELYRPQGYKHVIIDTFKPDTNRESKARWEKFSEHAQDIYDCIKPSNNNCATLATVQLKIGKEYRYLDLSTLGKSLEIVEVAGTVLAGRLLYTDEYAGGKFELKPYNWKKNEFTGKWEKDFFELDPNKLYLVIFIAKNRFGGTEEQIIYEVNYDLNSWIEIGYVKVPRTSNADV